MMTDSVWSAMAMSDEFGVLGRRAWRVGDAPPGEQSVHQAVLRVVHARRTSLRIEAREEVALGVAVPQRLEALVQKGSDLASLVVRVHAARVDVAVACHIDLQLHDWAGVVVRTLLLQVLEAIAEVVVDGKAVAPSAESCVRDHALN